MVMLQRFFRHFVAGYWQVQRQFPLRVRQAIGRATEQAEALHNGEMRFVVEAALNPFQIMHGVTPRERALEVFSLLRIWDTEQNAGVLIYVLLGDHAVEIIADRGIQQRVQEEQAWPPILANLQQDFAAGRYEAGAVAEIHGVSRHLQKHFPLHGANPNELSNEPGLL
jgi:uncharacterized membrane protein